MCLYGYIYLEGGEKLFKVSIIIAKVFYPPNLLKNMQYCFDLSLYFEFHTYFLLLRTTRLENRARQLTNSTYVRTIKVSYRDGGGLEKIHDITIKCMIFFMFIKRTIL